MKREDILYRAIVGSVEPSNNALVFNFKTLQKAVFVEIESDGKKINKLDHWEDCKLKTFDKNGLMVERKSFHIGQQCLMDLPLSEENEIVQAVLLKLSAKGGKNVFHKYTKESIAELFRYILNNRFIAFERVFVDKDDPDPYFDDNRKADKAYFKPTITKIGGTLQPFVLKLIEQWQPEEVKKADTTATTDTTTTDTANDPFKGLSL